jgi:hypothetical protein
MQNRGKWVIVGIVGVGFVAALASLLYHRQTGRNVLETWGTETALLVARAPTVRVLQLQPAQNATPSDEAQPIQRLGIGGAFYVVAAAKDATEARGLSNIRRAMVLDASYDWSAAAETAKPSWQYGMEFSENAQRTMLLFDFESRRVGSTVNDKTTVMRPEAASDWRKFFEEQWEAKSKK